MARFYDGALDAMATRLSQFRNPTIPELVLNDEHTLQNNLLECIMGIFSGEDNRAARYLMTNLVRHVHASVEAYRVGREQALLYVSGDFRGGVVSPYFRALAAFEQCVARSWQICDLLNASAETKLRVFEKGDGSDFERLHSVYTNGLKHAAGAYDAAHGEMPTSIWLTDSGVSCISGAEIRYEELRDIVGSGDQLFYDVQKHIRDKAKRQREIGIAVSVVPTQS